MPYAASAVGNFKKRIIHVLPIIHPSAYELQRLTNSFVGVQAGVFNGSVVALLWVFFVFFVDPSWTVSVGQPIVCEIHLKQTQVTNYKDNKHLQCISLVF